MGKHAQKISLRKPETKGPLGRPMRRYEDNIKNILKTGYEGVV
jgi:hypothetical protein